MRISRKKEMNLRSAREWAIRNPEKRKEHARRCAAKSYAENPEKYRSISSEWRANNPEKAAASYAHWMENRGTEWRREYERAQRVSNPNRKIKQNLSRRVRHALAAQTSEKYLGTVALLGCSIPELKNHISTLLKPEWSWENYGKAWELDHVKPCARFDLTNSDQQKACFHWSNYQPLAPSENRAKGARA
jgi:hypothetical protein